MAVSGRIDRKCMAAIESPKSGTNFKNPKKEIRVSIVFVQNVEIISGKGLGPSNPIQTIRYLKSVIRFFFSVCTHVFSYITSTFCRFSIGVEVALEECVGISYYKFNIKL